MAVPIPPRVLVVDGDLESRSLIRDSLRAEGCDAVTAGSGEEAALALSSGRPPDLLIIDPATPCLHSSGAWAAIRDCIPSRCTPVLGIMAALEQAHAQAPAQLAVLPEPDLHDFLVRPIDPLALRVRVRSLLRFKAAHDRMAVELERQTEIGIALSAELNLQRLLERIVAEARAINYADAATLYTVDRDAEVLRFQVLQNEHAGMLQHESGIDLPPVPLVPSNVSAYVALTGEIVNIPDVYAAGGFDFSGPRQYDALTGYRSRSMLVVPIRNHEQEVIAVLQLINAQDPRSGEAVPFRSPNVERTHALASQAGIALTNARLVADLQALFEGLIQVMARAVDEKSAYTAGHIRRVTRLALLLAEAVNECPDGDFGGEQLSEEELNELRIAGLLHDIGKIVIPEHVVDKATKLQCVYDRIDLVRTRFSAIRRVLENQVLRRKLELIRAGVSLEALSALDEELERAVHSLEDDLEFLEAINRGGEVMAPEKMERLRSIAARTWVDDQGVKRPYLTEDEARNLAIARGTLLPEELELIRSHAAKTIRLLEQIPFSRKLRNVPLIAGDHHEALNGTGYPAGKTAGELCLQSRILAVADIYDALSAADRPYKKAYSREVAERILREEVEKGRLDPRLVDLFIRADCYGRLQQEDGSSQ
jgi:HD-GYP domain-containing protein (c-di-GMP phosphodiesterase class II)